MKPTTDKIAIKDLRVLGTYGKMYHDADIYPHSLRKLSKDVKKNDITAITMAALLFSHMLSPNAIIIPVPQSSGIAEYTLEIANTIKVIRQDCKVLDILSGTPRKKLYEIKKSKSSLKGVKTGMKVKEDADCLATLQENSNNIFLLDNVVNTGFTFDRAKKALKKYAKKINPALLTISATSNWF